jgi:hypothetical protein
MSRTPTSASSPTCSASFWPRPRPQDTRPSRRHRSLMPRCIRTCCGTDRRRTPLACTGASGTGSTGHSTASKRGRQRAAAADSVPSLSGESYAGAVVTEAGTHDSVQSIVYVAAFAPDKGESVNTLIADPPPGAPVPPILPPYEGLPPARPDQVRALVRRRPSLRSSGLHGRLPGPVGRRCPVRHHRRPRLAEPAELVPRRHRGSDDPPAGPARHGRPGRLHRERGGRQPLRLPVPTRRSGHIIAQAAAN